ncbi:UDP-GlcNAc:betaGal beta-1,3-N-acetylglucosaminyltransferase 9-like [Littorina saxatilis]|uniref:UDP-GlcNAc:betaGal beta-1,3-N-acetylglucosaminyltransferase 9-like n=1 Tax=Littorina saxatilis TaxID=31220 RepID=UPI0038B47DAD
MKARELSAYLMSWPMKWLPMEKLFVLLVVSFGALLFFLAATLVQQSQYDLVHQYIAARRAYNGRYANDLTEAGHVIKSLTSTSSERGTTSGTTQPTARPVTDPPWLQNRTKAVPLTPFVPGKNQRHPFLRRYVIKNPHLCGKGAVDVLIVIHSFVKNFQRRRILRETWAGTGSVQGVAVRRVFLLGRDGAERATQVHVNTEQATYGDVVQGDFTDAFPNLTLKAVTGLRWVNDHCPQAGFVLKADDDMFVNVFSLLETFMQRLSGHSRTVMCHAKLANTSAIIRDPKSRWFVPKTLLPGRTHWPAFCSGYVLAMTTDVVPGLYRASFSSAYVPVDDGFVYGVLPVLAGRDSLRYVDISPNLLLNEKQLLAQYRDPKKNLTYLAGAVNSETGLVKLWQATLNRLSPWAKQRASITRLQDAMTHKVL